MNSYNKYIVYILFILSGISSIFSQSIQELNRLKQEYEQIRREGQVLPTNQNQTDIENNRELQGIQQLFPYSPNEIDSLNALSKYFGYDFFTKRDTVSYWENLPTPPNYLIGAGDELIVSIWGETQIRQNYIVSKEGTIYDEKVGLLNIIGKDLKEAEIYLKLQFGKVYSTIKDPNPSTFIDVSIGRLGFINVNFVGAVKYPGVYPIHPFSNLISGLIQAGGIDTTGSLRRIEIKRNGETYNDVDLYSYLIKGELPAKIQLRDQDIVVIPTRFSTVKIDSHVFNPGIFESLPNETLKDMLFYAGGLKPTASEKIFVERIIPISLRNQKKINYKNFYINYNNADTCNVFDGDNILVSDIHQNISYVEIIGQVKRPGKYGFFEGMTLNDLIYLGGGFEDTTFTKSIYSKQAEIIRRNPISRYETIVPVNLDGFLDNNNFYDIKLQNLDRFVVHENLNFFERENVKISGEVNIPGSYPIINDNETLKSILFRSGGLTAKALEDGISIYRLSKYFNQFQNNENEDFENNSRVRVAWSNSSIELMPADSIIVMESTNTVNISGEIYNPGLIEFKKGKPIRYYINKSGGITNTGDRKKIIVIYANGEVEPNRWYNSPNIKDGSTIIVNPKEIQEPFNLTQFATNWTSILSSVITAIVLSQQISGSN